MNRNFLLGVVLACSAATQAAASSPDLSTNANPETLNADGSRTFNFVNNCGYPVWFGFAGGSVPAKAGGQCATDNDCYSGAQCVTTGAIRQCFWRNPVPANNNYELSANGGTSKVTFPVSAGASEVWSGVIAGRTGCSGGTCTVGDCGNDGSGGCLASRGFGQPATQAEFTLSTTGTDFYDVEIINGVSLPISMAPTLTSTMDLSQGPYFCGTPGARTASSSLLGGCSWEFSPPSNDYIWVRNGGRSCSQASDCGSGTTCGLSFNPGQANLLQKTCGAFIGYWTADQVCGINPTYGSPFNCHAAAGSVYMSDLYACTSPGSCYQPGANNTCCGCVNWDQAGVKVPGSSTPRRASARIPSGRRTCNRSCSGSRPAAPRRTRIPTMI